VAEGSAEERSQRLLARLDAFAAELARSGVSAEATTRLLESAWTAALHALALDELAGETAAARAVTPVPLAEPDPTAEPGVPLAA
jgi:hypothetical protein